MDNLIGKTLGQYEIVSLIGRGGMASVYLARQRSIGRTVAVKVLPPHLMNDDTFLKRFQREVQAVSRMQHPRIIPVHDYGEDEGVPYIVMAHIEGGSLAQLIQEQGALPLDDVVRLVEQIAEGLDYAHQQGVIHRDFKPSNVLLDKSENAYLLDFGIAKVSQETAQLTGSGIVGTPTYMAPEMFKQELPTPAVDIYALGVTLYQMLSGTTPFEGTTPVQLMYSHLNEPVPSIETLREDIPASIQIVLDKAMAKKPEERFMTAGEMAGALRRAAEGDTLEFEAPLAAPPGPPPPEEVIPVPEPIPAMTAPYIPANEQVTEDIPPNEQKPQPVEPPKEEPVREEIPRREKPKRVKSYESGRRGPGCFWTVVVIVLLVIFLGRSTSWLKGLLAIKNIGLGGADDALTSQEISQGLRGASALEVILEPGLLGGSLDVEAMSSEDNALEGYYESAIGGKLDVDYEMIGDTGQLTLSRGDIDLKPPKDDFKEDLTVSLTDVVPIDLIVRLSFGETTLDLDGLNLRSLTIEGGAGKTYVALSDQGTYEVEIRMGMGEFIVEIPEGMEARVEIDSGLSEITIDNDSLIEIDDNKWQTDNYVGATESIRVKIATGLGSIIVK
ncbi:MAG: protein kinase [Anaerolineae bacterium]|nr:protein kinase [Anaerolineae bacterium]